LGAFVGKLLIAWFVTEDPHHHHPKSSSVAVAALGFCYQLSAGFDYSFVEMD
jgi:hypothetical protein